MDCARWAAFDAANEYLAERRAKRAPRRPGDPPDGNMLQHMKGFRPFKSMERAVLDVTEAVLGQDGACLPGREPDKDLVEVCGPDGQSR